MLWGQSKEDGSWAVGRAVTVTVGVFFFFFLKHRHAACESARHGARLEDVRREEVGHPVGAQTVGPRRAVLSGSAIVGRGALMSLGRPGPKMAPKAL